MIRRTLLFATLYAVAIAVGRATVLPETNLAMFWPAAGVGVLWALRAQTRREVAVVGVLVGLLSTAGNALTGLPLPAGVLFGVANVVLTLGTRWLLARDQGERLASGTGLRRLRQFFRFMAAASLATVASALVGYVAMLTFEDPPWTVGIGWWMRNMTAVVVIAAPALTLGQRLLPLSRRVVVESLAVLVSSVAALVVVFGPGQHLPLAFVPFVFIVWAALRLPLVLAALEGGLVAVGTLVLVRLLEGGPFGDIASRGDQALVVQGYMLLAVTLALVIGTVQAQMADVVEVMTTARSSAENAAEDLRILVEAIPFGLFLVDRTGAIQMHNRAAERWMTGGTEPDAAPPIDSVLIKRTLEGDDVPLDARPSVRVLRGEHVSGERLSTQDHTGRTRIVSVDGVPLHTTADGASDRAVLMWQDVTEEHQHVDELEQERQRSDRLIADAPHGVAVVDLEGRVLQINDALLTMFGRTEDEVVGAAVSELTPESASAVEQYLDRVTAGGGRLVEGEWVVTPPDEVTLHLAVSGRVIRGRDDAEILVNVVDVSDRHRYEERLAHIAHHDVLTGLPNRRRFEEVLSSHEDLCRRYGPRGALLLIDLDNFKEVNDTLGHAAGDHLIATTGSVLRSSLRASDVVARIGGDEFAVLLPEADEQAAEAVAASLVLNIRTHCESLEAARRRVTASIGVVSFAAAASRDTDALALADMLMYDAKDDGRNGYRLLTSDTHQHPRSGARMEWRARIEEAIAHDLFEVHLQPILDLHTGTVNRAEALVRLRDGDVLVPPGRFVYIAELTGLAPRLDAWVLRRSIAMLAELRTTSPDFMLEVNISGHSIGRPEVERTMRDALEEFGVPAGAVVLEVTETAAVQDVPAARGFGERLRALGTHFALDDFGAGYGSFYYLKHLVFDHVKIDGEFVSDSARSLADRQMLRSIVDVARNLDKATVAEFVSDAGILQVVRELGVDYAQGFHIGRPVPLDEFVEAHLRSEVRAVPALTPSA